MTAAITADQAYELDRMNTRAYKNSLGTVLRTAQSDILTLSTSQASGLLTGFVSGAGTVAASDTILQGINKLSGNLQNRSVLTNLLTAYSAGAGVVSSADTVLGALQKLDGNITAITPAKVLKYSGQVTTAGGAALETVTVAGVLNTDYVLINIKTKGATPRTLVQVACGTGNIGITFSGDPSTDHVIQYFVFR